MLSALCALHIPVYCMYIFAALGRVWPSRSPRVERTLFWHTYTYILISAEQQCCHCIWVQCNEHTQANPMEWPIIRANNGAGRAKNSKTKSERKMLFHRLNLVCSSGKLGNRQQKKNLFDYYYERVFRQTVCSCPEMRMKWMASNPIARVSRGNENALIIFIEK